MYDNTTASAANMFVTSAGFVQRSTSSIKYKRAIEPLDDDRSAEIFAAANNALIWYRSKCEGDNPAWGFYGISAEALAPHAPQFVSFATTRVENSEEERTREVETTDENDEPITVTETYMHPITRTVDLETPEPEGVAYERLVVICIREIAKLQARIAALEAAP
jgi:hypothetical protein